jgi:hypothetical protein
MVDGGVEKAVVMEEEDAEVEASHNGPCGGKTGQEEMGTDTEVDGSDGAGETDPTTVQALPEWVPLLRRRRRRWRRGEDGRRGGCGVDETLDLIHVILHRQG